MKRLVVVAVCGISAAARAGAPDEIGSASDVTVSADEMKLRLHDGSTDLLRDVPGMFLSQSAGGALADQFSLRGFDGRAATDVSVIVDGVPVNLPSHPDGDGFADTHFLIAPTVSSITLRKGPQSGRAFGIGNAGELSIRTLDVVPGNGVYIAARSGSMASDFTQAKQRLVRLMHRAVAMTSPTLTHGDAIIAAEVGITDGFSANPQRFRRSVLMAKWRHPTSSGDIRLAANLYAGRWAESGLVPAADIEAGALGRFDSVDPSQGGTTTRASISAMFETPSDRSEAWRLGAFAVASDWQHFENPTLFLRNDAEGDQNLVIDSRRSYGMYGDYRRALGWRRTSQLNFGVDLRNDDGSIERWRTVRQHKTTDCFAEANPCQSTDPTIVTMGIYARQQLDLTPALRITGGVRLDQYIWNIDDRDSDSSTTNSAIDGSASRARLSPSLSVRLRHGATTWLLNGQLGARTTDAHAAVLSDSYAAVVRALTADAGVRVRPSPQLEAAATLWYTNVEEQQVWDSLAQRVNLAPASTRVGLDTWVKFRPRALLGLQFDAALSLSPTATLHTPRWLASSGLGLARAQTTAALRVRSVGMHGDAGYTLLAAVLGRRWGRIDAELTAENLLNRAWNEADITAAYRSTRAGDATTGRMITPGAPRTVMATVGVRL